MPADDRCGVHYARHPDKAHLAAVCTLPPGHEGPHDNRLAKPEEAILRNPMLEQGRRLASEREDLIARGVDPADLEVPLAPDDGEADA